MTDRTLDTIVVPRFTLESGVILNQARLAYHLDGKLNLARDNVVVIFHSLTGSADAAGGWWAPLIGSGKALDTDRYAILAPNLLGSCYGSTGPSSWAEGPFPAITTRDQARFAALALDALRVRSVALVTGGSLGGMVALEWLATFPGLTRGATIFAAPPANTAYGIAWNHIMREAIAIGGPAGLALARKVGMMTYRTERELNTRFGRERRASQFEVEAYLDHQGRKLVSRFDSETYRVLLDAMDSHDIGRGRGRADVVLRGLPAPVTAVGIPGDLLYGADEIQQWAQLAGVRYETIESAYGHDAFLLEWEQIGAILRESLAAVEKDNLNGKRKVTEEAAASISEPRSASASPV